MKTNEGGMTEDTKTLIVVLCLIFVYPVGVVLMLVWMRWKWWIKLLVGLPLLLVPLAIIGIVLVAMLAAINPKAQVEKAREVGMRNDAMELNSAIERYYSKNGEFPWGGDVDYSSSNALEEEWIVKLVDTGELKGSFLDKAENSPLYIQKEMGAQGKLLVCFKIAGDDGETFDCVPKE